MVYISYIESKPTAMNFKALTAATLLTFTGFVAVAPTAQAYGRDFDREQCMSIVREAHRNALNGVGAQSIVDNQMVDYVTTDCDYNNPRGMQTIEAAVDYAQRWNGV